MKRLMIQADERLLERARLRAAERGVSIAQVVRDALEKELGNGEQLPPPLTCIGMIADGSGLSRRAADDEYVAEPYR